MLQFRQMIDPRTKTIIWDLDGTLLNSFGVFAEVLVEVLKVRNHKIPPRQVLLDNFHGRLVESIHNCLGGSISGADLEAIVKDFLTIQNTHYEIIEHHLFTDALGLAQRAASSGITQFLVTNREHEGRLNASPRNIVANSGLSTLISEVICGDDNEHRKPNTAVVEKLLASGRLAPATTIVIGDQAIDAEFARNLNTKAILVNRNGTISHMAKLGNNWQSFTTVVSSLDEVQI